MKLLYGSQNFGYDIDNSDKDWLEIVYPSWQDILNNKLINKEIKNEDGSVTKVKDIRCLIKMIEKCNFNDLQVLYSQEMYECEDLKWFIEHREEIVKHNLRQLYFTNRGYVVSCLMSGNSKDMIRAYCFMQLIERAFSGEVMNLCDKSLRDLRNQKDNQILAHEILERVDRLKELAVASPVHDGIVIKARKEIERLLKLHMM